MKNHQDCANSPTKMFTICKYVEKYEFIVIHCTMCTLYSIFSSRPNKMGHDITLPYCDIIQHIFIPTRSVARKTLLWTFSWASNSKFAIFLQLYPCNNYRAIKYPPVSIECGMEYPPVSQTLLIQGDNLSPCIIYRAFLNTGGSYCTMCTLCNGEFKQFG